MKKLKVLIVEDDRGTQALYKHGLSSQIFECSFAATGGAALDAYREWHPDIMVLDIGLPDIDGISVLKAIREESEDDEIHVIVASSLSDRERVLECIRIGIQDFIVKPIHSKTISDKILKCYNRPSGDKDNLDNEIIMEMSKHNWLSLDKVEINHIILQINYGIEVQLEIEGVGARLRTFVTGIHHGEYVLVQCPKLSAIETKLYEGNSVRVLYLYSGTVYAFNSKVLNYIKNPMKLIFLSYPESVEAHELRKNQRVDCYLPARLRSKVKNSEYSGLVIDISIGGCRFVANCQNDDSRSILVGDDIELTLELAGLKDAVSFSGRSKNVAQDGRRISVGIEFGDPDGNTLKTVETYLRTISHLL